MKRSSKCFIILAALLFWYAAAGFLVFPWLIRHFAEKALQERFGPESIVAKVRINPFSGAFRVEGLAVADPGAVWSLAWKEAEFNLSGRSLLQFYPVFDRVWLDGADIRFERTGSGPPSEDMPPSRTGRDWRGWVEALNGAEVPEVRIDRLEVANGRVEFTDQTTADPYREVIESIDFNLRDFTTAHGEDTLMELTARTDKGAVLRWEGDLRSRPLWSSGNLALSGLPVHGLAPYYRKYLRFDLKRAVFGIRFHYRLDLSDPENLWQIERGQLELTEVLCEPVDDPNELITVETIRAEGIAFHFPNRTVHVSDVLIENGETRVFRDADGRINLAELLALPEVSKRVPPEAGPSGGTSLPAPSYQIDRFAVRDYRVAWEDALQSDEVALLRLTVPEMDLTDITSDAETPIRIVANYEIGETGTARIEGVMRPARMGFNLAMTVQSFPLNLFSPYAREFGKTEISDGSFDFDGRVRMTDAGRQTLTGDATIRAMRFTHDQTLQGQWENLDLEGVELELSPFNLSVGTTRLKRPELVATIRRPAADKETVGGAEGEPSAKLNHPIRVDQIILSEGRFMFEDERMEPAARIQMNAIDLKLAGLNLADPQPAELALRADINGSPLVLDGTVSVSDFKEATRLNATLRGLSLPVFSPYSAKAVGRRIANGRFDLDSEWTLRNSRLEANNRIRIEAFKLGDKVTGEGSTALPLDLAVSLLKGPSGIMDLSLPLSGDLSDPKAGIGQIVGSAIIGLITKAATAPFSLLSNLVGSDQDLSRITFAAGSAELQPDMTTRLIALAEALKKRPELELGITPLLSEKDLERLADTKLRLALLDGAAPDNTKLYHQRLTSEYRKAAKAAGAPDRETNAEDPGGLEKMLALLLPGVDLDEADKTALATERAAAVQNYLVSAQNIEPDRLTVNPHELDAPEPGALFTLE